MVTVSRHVLVVLATYAATLWACGCGTLPAAPAAPTPVPPLVEQRLGATRPRDRDGMAMVFVPAGAFEMGSDDAQIDGAIEACVEAYGDGEHCRRADYALEQPVHTVQLDAFWIDRTEVTNRMFAQFLNEQGNHVENGVSWLEPGAGHGGVVYGHIAERDGVFRSEAGYEEHPAIEVSWYGAAAYCTWAGGRLPTEAEWAYAARGPEARVYPWGNTFDGARVNYCDASCPYRWRDTSFDDRDARWGPVGSHPDGVSWCGTLDMVGNVWEWVSDRWSDSFDTQAPNYNPQGPTIGALRVARGGSWYEESWRVRAATRKGLTPSSYRMHWIGFRCATSTE